MTTFHLPFLKISPPEYFLQNSEIAHIQMNEGTIVRIMLDYEINNFLKIGNEYCNPDPLYKRDECALKQLLNVSDYIQM